MREVVPWTNHWRVKQPVFSPSRLRNGLSRARYQAECAAREAETAERHREYERGRPLTELEKTKNYLLYLARLLPDDRSDQLGPSGLTRLGSHLP